jgi:hypothetical protein
MSATLTRYGAALLPLGVLVLGVFDAAQSTGTNLIGWQTITQLVLLLATTGAAFVLKLVPGKWAGALKTGAAVVGAIVSALVAVVPDGHFTTATLILFLTAALKAVAVQFGVSIRTDAATIDARETPAGEVPSITSVGESLDDAPEIDLAPLATHEVVGGAVIPIVGNAEAEQPGTVPDGDGEHRAAQPSA